MRKLKPRSYVIDGKDYAVSISGGDIDESNEVQLTISFRALFGNRSVCQVRGVTNRSFWHDYPNAEAMKCESISISPRIVCQLVQLAHAGGWNPETSKSNFEIIMTKETVRTIISQPYEMRETGV